MDSPVNFSLKIYCTIVHPVTKREAISLKKYFISDYTKTHKNTQIIKLTFAGFNISKSSYTV